MKELFGIKDKAARYLVIKDWEQLVLEHLFQGLEIAFEFAPHDENLVKDLFQWLGQSGLVKRVYK